MYSAIFPCVDLLTEMKSTAQRCAAMLQSPTPPAWMQTFSEKGVRLAQQIQAGPRILVGMQLEKA